MHIVSRPYVGDNLLCSDREIVESRMGEWMEGRPKRPAERTVGSSTQLQHRVHEGRISLVPLLGGPGWEANVLGSLLGRK